jgi:CBS-domain-containing membrane protein
MRTWRVDDVMTVDVVTVREETPYRDIVDTLAERRVSAAPVIDQDRRVVGVVSEADLLHKIEFVGEEHERRVFASRRQRTAHAKAHGSVARDVMSSPAITVVPGTTLTAAAKLMDDEKIKRLPVTDELGRLAGIVSRGDLLRVYLRPDAEIERDVVDGVLHRTLWVEPGLVSAKVHDGVVTLTGRTDRYSTAQLAVKLTETVPGVVEVVDRLGFKYDDRRLAEASHYGPNPFGMP